MATALSGKMPLVGFDTNPERRHAVAHLALEWVTSLAELANRAGTVVLSLPKPEISKAVVTELVQGAKAPELIIETSTVTPQVAQELHAICQPQPGRLHRCRHCQRGRQYGGGEDHLSGRR